MRSRRTELETDRPTTLSICMVLLISFGFVFLSTMAPSQEVSEISIEEPKYPPGVPKKFTPDGKVQPCPGNTVIAHLPQSSDLHKSLRALHDKLKSSHLSHLYTLLPPSS
ncbi:hypothetical protein K438DRAFT_283804 [Mycena galopus ATCC 62051]|nr:hypothetical protein K438DRAFT_283804 [Mycena galopus ATCC 62051]